MVNVDPENVPAAIPAGPLDGADERSIEGRRGDVAESGRPSRDDVTWYDEEPAADESWSDAAADGAPPADEQPVVLSRWARLTLAGVTVVIGLALAVHLLAMFLGAAPANTLSQRYQKQLTTWTEPWLEQNWKLFAPNPVSENVTIQARGRLVTGFVGPWVNLSAADDADTLHNPMPDHETQNQLRNAWFDYLDDVPTSGDPTTLDGTLMRQQLCRVTLDRLDRLGSHLSGRIDAIMLQVTTTPVPAPGTKPSAAPRPSVQTLPWWPTATTCGSTTDGTGAQ